MTIVKLFGSEKLRKSAMLVLGAEYVKSFFADVQTFIMNENILEPLKYISTIYVYCVEELNNL